MYFLLSTAAFAALVLFFHVIVLRSRAKPEMFDGDWRAPGAAIFFTGGFAASLGAMLASASAAAPNFFVALSVAGASAVVITVVIGIFMRRRLSMPGAPMPG